MRFLLGSVLYCIMISVTLATNNAYMTRQVSRSDPNIRAQSPVKRADTMPSLKTNPSISSVITALDDMVNNYLKKMTAKVNQISKEVLETSKKVTDMQTDLGYIMHYIYPPSCSAVTADVYSKSGGIVTIKPPTVPPTRVSCEREPSGDTWTVVLRRNSGIEKFNRSYKEYQTGFGNPNQEYWIGNEVLHALTLSRPHVLRVQLESFDGKKAAAYYDVFSVGSSKSSYQLIAEDYDEKKSTAGDGLKVHNKMKFTTYDSDNDLTVDGNCANLMGGGGGWWYNTCYHVLGTGQYRKQQGNEWGGVHWYPWKEVKQSLKSFVMSIKPKEATPVLCPTGSKC